MDKEVSSVSFTYNGKTKTFTNSCMANMLLESANPEIMYRQVTPEIYYEFNMHKFWDDYTEMTGEEWAKIANKLLSNFN